MKTAIIYYSEHHGNTKKLLDAMAGADPELELINVLDPKDADLKGYDTFGPFKLVGGLAKGHPTQEENDGAVAFYKGLK